MAVNKSIIEDVELENGLTFYVQSSGGKDISISFDGPDTGFNIRFNKDELPKLIEAMVKVKEEVENG